MSNALAYLQQLADAAKVAKHPPFANQVPTKYSDESADGLICCIVDYLKLSYQYDARLQVADKHRPFASEYNSYQKPAGMPDVLAYVNGQLIGVYVEFGKDCFSAAKKQTSRNLISSGICIYVARTFEGFYDWFITNILTTSKLSAALYNQRHPIPHLATPDLPEQKPKP